MVEKPPKFVFKYFNRSSYQPTTQKREFINSLAFLMFVITELCRIEPIWNNRRQFAKILHRVCFLCGPPHKNWVKTSPLRINSIYVRRDKSHVWLLRRIYISFIWRDATRTRFSWLKSRYNFFLFVKHLFYFAWQIS